MNEKSPTAATVADDDGRVRTDGEELEHQISLEEKKSGISDPNHFAYPTFAKAARQRADNLQVSIKELKVQQDAAELALEEAQAEHSKATALEERDATVRARA